MDTEGYLLLPGFLDPTNLVKAMEPYRNRTDYIFNAPGNNDHKRRQVSLHQGIIQELQAEIQSLPFLSNVHHVEDFVLLRSLSGCKRQAAHTDYIPETSLLQCDTYKLPLLFLFALEENTKLVVWPGSHKVIQGRGRTVQPIQPRTVTLDRGDALVFRADLVHAGAEYETENIRIHCYIDSDLVKRNPNRTWIIGKHADELVREKIRE